MLLVCLLVSLLSFLIVYKVLPQPYLNLSTSATLSAWPPLDGPPMASRLTIIAVTAND